MRNLKKFLALVLAMMMAFSLMVTANATNSKAEYPDMEKVTDQFEEAVDVLTGMGVFRGDNGEFRPDRPIMRSEAVAVMYRLVTGDTAKPDKSMLYAPAAKFNDVPADAWYTGYVGWAVDAGIVKGYDGNFLPTTNVTGYQMLTMLLRAVGYGKNGEFTGSLYMVNVGSLAEQLGILDNINTTHYNNTLSQASPREVVAELTFQTAAYVPTVRYEMGYYNQYKGVALAQGNNELNPTLGQIKFGLTGVQGIVVGNQATGEGKTLLGVKAKATWDNVNNAVTKMTLGGDSYVYATDTSTTFALGTLDANATLEMGIKTGLDLFGHKATVWFNDYTSTGTQDVGTNGLPVSEGFSTVYAVVDEATMTDYVYAKDGNLASNQELNGAVDDAGFKLNGTKTAHFSDRYCQMGVLEGNITTTGQVSPINTYAVISNSGKTVDVVIGLSAEVAEITQKNTTAKKPYVILGNDDSAKGNVSSFGDGTSAAGKILEGQLTDASVRELGKTVTAYEIVGTTDSTPNTRDLGWAKGKTGYDTTEFKYQLDDMKSFTATVSSYKLGVGPTVVAVDGTSSDVISVNLVGRDKPMLLSGITRGDGTNSEIISGALDVVTSLSANTTYTVYEDLVGRFISLTTGSGYEFLYGTFADFETGALGTGTIVYSMVGVNWDGQKLTNNVLKSIGGTPTDGALYDGLDVTLKAFGSTTGNEIRDGENTGYMYNATTGDLQPYGGKSLVDGASWTIKSSDATNGFVKVNNSSDGTSGTDYLLTKDTRFIVVSGHGTADLTVTPYKGLADFLQGHAEAVISYNDGDDHVIFKTEAEKYGTVDTQNNGVITDIILSVDNINRWNSTTMFFNFDTSADTGMVLPGTNPDEVKQYALWCDGELGYYFVDSTAVGGVAPTTTENFYNLVKIYERGGVPVYKAVLAGTGNLTGAGYASNDITYKYITVSTLDTGLFEDASDSSLQKVMSIAGAKVCDVQSKTGAASTRNEIKTLLELNNAVSVRQPDGTTAVYGVGVAIVYDGISVKTIYVTNVT